MRNTDKPGNLMGRWKYSVDWINLAQNKVGQQAPVNTEMNFGFQERWIISELA